MIRYTEKGAGLHAAIAAAGLLLREENGVWVSSDDAAVQAVIDGYTLDKAKATVSALVNDYAKTVFDKAVAGTSAAEMAGWPILRAEAIAYNANAAASCPAMTAEAAQRGITLAALAVKVTGNANHFDGLRAAVAGNSGKHRDALAALTTFDAVLAYDFRTGWPVV
jgi:hypothetical protein